MWYHWSSIAFCFRLKESSLYLTMKKIISRLSHRNTTHPNATYQHNVSAFENPKKFEDNFTAPTRSQLEPKTNTLLQLGTSCQLQQKWLPTRDEINQLRLQILQNRTLLHIKQLIISYKKGQRLAVESFSQEGLGLVLLEASRRGRIDVLSYMLSKFRHCVSINQLIKTPPFGLMSCEVPQKRGDFPGKHCTYTLLHVATGVLVTELLIQNGAMVDVKNCCGDTPLHIAIKRFVYENHEHVDIRHSDKTTINTIKCLVSMGADVNAKNSKGETPLMFAVENALVFKPLFELLQSSVIKLNLNAADNRGLTALHRASSAEISQTLLENGANPQFYLPSLDIQYMYVPCPLYLAAAGYTRQSTHRYLIHPLCSTAFRVDAKLITGAAKRFKLTYVTYGLYNGVKDDWQDALQMATHCMLHTQTLPLLNPITDIIDKDEVRSTQGLDMAIRIMEIFIGKNHPYLVFLYHKAHRLCHESQPALNYLMKAAQLLLCQLQQHNQREVCLRLAEIRDNLQEVFTSYMCLQDYWCQKSDAMIVKHHYVEFLKIGMQILSECKTLECTSFHCYWKLENSCARSMLWCFNRWVQEHPESEECYHLGRQFVVRYHSLFRSSLLEIALSPHPPLQFSSLRLLNALLTWGAAEQLNKRNCQSSPTYLLHAIVTTNLGSHLECSKQEILSLLINFGAHLDIVDHHSRSCLSVCSKQDIGDYLRTHLPLPLSCLASIAIVAHGFNYYEMPLPKHVKELVSYHDASGIEPPLNSSPSCTPWNYRSLHRLMYHDACHCSENRYKQTTV